MGFRCQSLSAKRFMDVSEPKLEEHKLLRIDLFQIISRHVVHSVVIVMFGSRNGLVFFLYCCRSWFPGQQCVMFVVAIIVTDGAIVIVVTVVIIVVIRVVIIVVSCCLVHLVVSPSYQDSYVFLFLLLLSVLDSRTASFSCSSHHSPVFFW